MQGNYRLITIYGIHSWELHSYFIWISTDFSGRLQWDGRACCWMWEVCVDCRIICWYKRSLCITWESSPNFDKQFYCLSSMPLTCIHLGDSNWYLRRFPPWFWEIGIFVGSPPRAPDSTVLDVYGCAFWSLSYRLTWWSWAWDFLIFLPSLEISLAF